MTVNMTPGLTLVAVQHQNPHLHLIQIQPEVCGVPWSSCLYIMLITVHIKGQEIVHNFGEVSPAFVLLYFFFFFFLFLLEIRLVIPFRISECESLDQL